MVRGLRWRLRSLLPRRTAHSSPRVLPMTDTLITTVAELQEAVTAEARKAVQGQQQVLEQMLVCLLSRGHVLLEGVAGIAKTLLAKTLAAIVGADFKRIQFTPDLLP